MRLLLTNDDGYGEPGLVALQKACRRLRDCESCVVVAPDRSHSFGGHQVNMRRPLRTQLRAGLVDNEEYAVDGTPADCVRLGLKQLAPQTDWVVAGINPGANLGSDVYQSGTVAAAREAAILGIPAIAISHYVAAGQRIDWELAEELTVGLLARVIATGLPPGCYLNVNLPSPLCKDDLARLVDVDNCPLDRHPHSYRLVEDDAEKGLFHYRGIIHDRPHQVGSDVDVCFSGRVSVSLLQVCGESRDDMVVSFSGGDK